MATKASQSRETGLDGIGADFFGIHGIGAPSRPCAPRRRRSRHSSRHSSRLGGEYFRNFRSPALLEGLGFQWTTFTIRVPRNWSVITPSPLTLSQMTIFITPLKKRSPANANSLPMRSPGFETGSPKRKTETRHREHRRNDKAKHRKAKQAGNATGKT